MNNRKVKILKTTVINDNNISNKSKKLNKKTFIFSMLLLLLFISIMIIPRNSYKSIIRKILAYAGIYTEEIKSVEIESNDYNNPGSFKITKSAKWLSSDTVQVTFDLESIFKRRSGFYDVVILIDTSSTMAGNNINVVMDELKEVLDLYLSDYLNNNNVAIIDFNSTSQLLTGLTNSKTTIFYKIDNLETSGNRNYNAGLQALDSYLQNYIKHTNRTISAVIITNGLPNEGTPSEVATYRIIKDKHPYLTINGIQYMMMDTEITDELKAITDKQFSANYDNLRNVLIKSILSSLLYNKFSIEDYIDTDYFSIDSISNINASTGSVEIDDESADKKIVWDLGENLLASGTKEKLTFNISLNSNLASNNGFYPIDEQSNITYKLAGEQEESITRTDSLVLKNKYNVTYEANAPEGCSIVNPSDSEYYIFSTVSKSLSELSCNGYLFRGWKIDEEDDRDIIHINEDLFIMPGHDVTVRAEWGSQSIMKSIDGVINNHATLYKVLKETKEQTNLAKEYTESHHDSFLEEPSEKIYYYYGSNNTNGTTILNKNNVLFANQCWQMVRTTDTGGVKMIYNGEAVNNQCLNTRETHVGYSQASILALNGNYWYGDDYTFNNSGKLFSISGSTEQVRWSGTTYQGLIGKYTCKKTTESGTCSTLYYVESYASATQAYVLEINSSSHYSQYGTLQFNYNNNSLAYSGYMYGNVRDSHSFKLEMINDLGRTKNNMISRNSLSISYYYADSISYDSTTNTYSLVNPYKVSNISDYQSLIGKYTFFYTTDVTSRPSVNYIAKVDGSNSYTFSLTDGINDFDHIIFGDSIIDNGNGTYTLDNTFTMDLSDWVTNYSNYNNYYTCNSSSSSVCSSPRYLISTERANYYYIESGNKIVIGKGRNGTTLTDTLTVRGDQFLTNRNDYVDYKYTCNSASNICTDETISMISSYNSTNYSYVVNINWGSSVTWDGTNYTLVDPLDVDYALDYSALSTHHYVCLNYGEKVCSTVGYVYLYSTGTIYYVELNNGEDNISDVMSDMIENNITNSKIKSGVDAWYKKYLLDYDYMMEDTIFCNNRSFRDISGWKENGGSITSELRFRQYDGMKYLDCAKVTDQFSINNPDARLTYKVGLMSPPELSLLNNSNITKTGSVYWMGSPSAFGYYGARGRNVYSDGNVTYIYPVTEKLGVRPAISLKPGTEYYAGDGSMANPYVVDIEE